MLTCTPLGLVINIVLNLLLLPIWGLYGAVAATAVSSLICLITILLLSNRYGLPLDRGIWLTVAAPLSLPAGPVIAAATLFVMLAALLGTRLILSSKEHAQLRQLLIDALNKLTPLRRRRAPVTGNT